MQNEVFFNSWETVARTIFALLISLQFAVTWLSVRFTWVRKIVKSEPSLLFYRGQMLQSAMREQRVTAEEVRAAIRSEGESQLENVEAVILETDGSFSVLPCTTQPLTAAQPDVQRL